MGSAARKLSLPQEEKDAHLQAVPEPSHFSAPGGFWIRFVALVIDFAVLYLVTFPFNLALLFLTGYFVNPAVIDSPVVQLGSILIGFFAYASYFGWFYSRRGGSPGKLLFGLRVVHHKTGSFVPFGVAVVRETLGKTLSALLFFGGFFFSLFRKDRRSLHDLLSLTQVIRLARDPFKDKN